MTKSTNLTAVWAEAWAVCAEQDKTPGGRWAGAHGTAGLSWDTDQEGSTTPVSEDTRENKGIFIALLILTFRCWMHKLSEVSFKIGYPLLCCLRPGTSDSTH